MSSRQPSKKSWRAENASWPSMNLFFLHCNLPAFIFTAAGNTRRIKLNLSIHPVRSVVCSQPASRVRCFQSTRCQYPSQPTMKLYETTYWRSPLGLGLFPVGISHFLEEDRVMLSVKLSVICAGCLGHLWRNYCILNGEKQAIVRWQLELWRQRWTFFTIWRHFTDQAIDCFIYISWKQPAD